jgi:preprotein translocase subunit SecD
MAGEDAESAPQPPPITPRPMIVRVLAALAIVAILVLSMWAVLRAAHNIKKTVRNDLTLHLTAEHNLTPTQLSEAADVLQRRAHALGYHATTRVDGDSVDVATDTKIKADDVKTLEHTGTIENRVVLGQLRADTPIPGGPYAGKRCSQLVDGKKWFWDSATPHQTCYYLGPVQLDGTAVTRAVANYSPQENGWGVDATYRGNEFVDKIAQPDVGKQVAIVFGGEVLSTPVIEKGITGNQIRISGAMNAAQARRLAAVLGSGELPDRFVVD